jgi:hypothetical protein
MTEARFSLLLFIVGLFGCFFHTCGPARAFEEATDRALSVLCPQQLHLAPVVTRVSSENLIHPAILVAKMKAESNCRSNRVNKRTGAIGLVQILYKGSANPLRRGRRYTKRQLRNPYINLTLGARHLNRYIHVCGCLGGAIHIYHGFKKCSGWRRDEHVQKVLRFYRSVFHEEVSSPNS